MVEAFVGLVGGGKSFNSVRRMMAYMARGGRVCANIRLAGYDDSSGDLSPDSPVRDYLRSLGWEYQPRQYIYIPFDEMVRDFEWIKKVPAGLDRMHRTFLVVDEATDLFDTLDGSKLRSDSDYREIFHFLRLSRHVHVDVLFIAQDIESINRRLRGLVSGIWRSTDMKNFRLPVLKIRFPFDLFLLQLFDRTGKYETRREWLQKDPRIFDLYESEAFNQSLTVKWDGVAIRPEDGRIRKGKKKMSIIERVLLFASLGFSVWALCSPSGRGRGGSVSRVVITSSVDRVSRPFVASDLITNVSPLVVRDVLEYRDAVSNASPYVVFGGKVLREGMPCEWGVVRMISRDRVWGFSFDGATPFHLLPLERVLAPSVSPVYMRVYRKQEEEKGGDGK